MEDIELVVRKHLDTRTPPTNDVTAVILEDILKHDSITKQWCTLSGGVEEGKELLCEICTLWCTIRVHAFVKV